jgi:hypothetical protein
MRLLKWLSLGAAVWIVYWGLAAWGLRGGFETWFNEQQRQGWQVSYGPMITRGFPLRHVTRLEQPLLADPGTGAAWSADWIEFDSPAIWPGAQSLRFPATPQHYSYFDQTRRLTAAEMRADLQLAPGLALELEQLSLTSQAWQIADADGVLWQAQDLVLEMRQMAQAEQYHLNAEARQFSPRGLLRAGFGGLTPARDDLPSWFEALRLRADLGFESPWDRRAIELRRPQLRQINLDLVEAHWGDMLFRASGELEVDEKGRLSGELALRAENWPAILDMAERLSLLPPSTRSAVEKVLELFSTGTGRAAKIDIPLRFHQGQVWAGPLPIGTAPPLVLR